MSGAEEKTPEQQLEALRARAAARNADLKGQFTAQRLIDETARFELEESIGATRVAFLDVPHTPGLPTMIGCQCPNDAQMKKYRARVKTKADGKEGDKIMGAEELAAQVRIYPPKDEEGDALYKRLLDARPGIHVALGVAAVKLAVASEQDEGKG